MFGACVPDGSCKDGINLPIYALPPMGGTWGLFREMSDCNRLDGHLPGMGLETATPVAVQGLEEIAVEVHLQALVSVILSWDVLMQGAIQASRTKSSCFSDPPQVEEDI